MNPTAKLAQLQSPLASSTSSDPYQDSAMFISRLKQEHTPEKSGDQDDYDDNDRFLEELERENMMLEKELENLMQLKSAQLKEIQQDTVRSPGQSLSPVNLNLEKIEEKVEEERESYCYSNSDDEHAIHRNKSKTKVAIRQEPELKRNEFNGTLSSSNLDFGTSELAKYKFDADDGEEESGKAREKQDSSPLRASHLDESTQDNKVTAYEIFEKKNPTPRMSLKDKENISTNENDLSSSDLSGKRRSVLGPHNQKKSKSKSHMSPPKAEKMDKTASLECRLAGANRAIKSLETELKAKNEKIQELAKEVEKKNKLLESYQSNILNDSMSQKSSQTKESLMTMMRKKEKELEKKVKDQEIMIIENKKYMARLQELNSKLLIKVKELEEENLFLKTNQDVSVKLKAYEDENKKMKDRIKSLEKENSQLSAQCSEQKSRIKEIVNVYDNIERKSERFLQKNNAMTDTLLSLINMHNDWISNYNQEEEYTD